MGREGGTFHTAANESCRQPGWILVRRFINMFYRPNKLYQNSSQWERGQQFSRMDETYAYINDNGGTLTRKLQLLHRSHTKEACGQTGKAALLALPNLFLEAATMVPHWHKATTIAQR